MTHTGGPKAAGVCLSRQDEFPLSVNRHGPQGDTTHHSPTAGDAATIQVQSVRPIIKALGDPLALKQQARSPPTRLHAMNH